MTHWVDRRTEVAELGKALAALGWKLYGWKEDQSDSMTDYFSPEHWDGVATKAGAVCVVDISPKYATPGKVVSKIVPQPGQACESCQGSGTDKTWTLEQARKDPRGFHAWEHTANKMLANCRPMMPDVVSPLGFKNGGYVHCQDCHGVGHTWLAPTSEVVETWPDFQGNPGRSNWHVERDGRILAKGTGLNACRHTERVEDPEAFGGWRRVNTGAQELAAKIDRAAEGKSTDTWRHDHQRPDSPTQGVQILHNEQLDGIEVRFSDKPPEKVRATLKRLGFRWSKFQGLWYAKAKNVPPTEELELLLSAFPSP